ncbi:peptidase C69-like protein [Tamaricihabitans halophyticus]|uniref:Peptidase C69-like protein n=1 Tax=Tamaricihabitans halophyticus TaxID=1262583 RepID=A0A4R2QY58_9PSEU|nr:C69 family dipeptidase [Tamaricihabitans halophyticus]TCP54324.1 peptidase C69-like protein [Tamaricihabitans halophyticus]
MRRARTMWTVGAAVLAVGMLLPLAPMGIASPSEAGDDSRNAGRSTSSDKSFAVYIGKNRTESGNTLLGGFGHEPSSHWLDIVPKQRHAEDATIEVGATGEADIPGELTEIPQVPETARYITSNYSEFAGFPAPLTNGGLNEHGVAARDVWSDSRPELVEQTPTPQRGPNYSDLSRIAMERATSAREAVEIVGGLIDEYGYTTYGGNSHMFADANEGWVLVEFAGGEGLWAAERLGPDDVRVSYPGYIGEFPTDFRDNDDYLASDNIVDYAEQRGWWNPDSGRPFNLREVYGTPFPGESFELGEVADEQDESPYRHPPSLEAEFRELGDVRLEDMMRIVRDPRWSDDRAGYGQVAELDDSLADPYLNKLWVAVTSAVTTPYVPFYIGSRSVPVEFRQHRYLTHNSASEYLDPEFAEQEATEYATQTFKRLLYSTCSRPEKYLTDVTEAIEGLESIAIDRTRAVERTAAEDFAAGRKNSGQNELNNLTVVWSGHMLSLGNYLLEDQLRRTAADGGPNQPRIEPAEGVAANSQSLDMSLRSDASARDRVNCDLGGGWADGSTLDRQGSYGDPENVPEDFADGLPEETDAAWLPYVLTGAGGLLVGAAGFWLFTRTRARR